MNLWASMLADLPVLGQRAIARYSRISLPRNASSSERIPRIRRALCRRGVVLASYATLEQAAQAALQHLRAVRGGIAPDELRQRYGGVRSWVELAADPQPQTIAEQLLLRGWLLPRPATPRHPARWLVPPEVRHALPRPLCLSACPITIQPTLPLACRAATALLIAAQQPIKLRTNGTLPQATLRQLATLLSPFDPAAIRDCFDTLVVVLRERGLLHASETGVMCSAAGRRFLAKPNQEQSMLLLEAWLASAQHDRWLRAVAPDTRGMDWPLFRRRLLAWVESLPIASSFAADQAFQALVAAHGPLADAHTHGFRMVDRVPWRERRTAAIWHAALAGPLSWFGLVVCTHGDYARPPAAPTVVEHATLGEPGEITVPHANSGLSLVIAPFAHRHHSTTDATTYHITPESIACACRDNYSIAVLRATLERISGPFSAEWNERIQSPPQLQ